MTSILMLDYASLVMKASFLVSFDAPALHRIRGSLCVFEVHPGKFNNFLFFLSSSLTSKKDDYLYAIKNCNYNICLLASFRCASSVQVNH